MYRDINGLGRAIDKDDCQIISNEIGNIEKYKKESL